MQQPFHPDFGMKYGTLFFSYCMKLKERKGSFLSSKFRNVQLNMKQRRTKTVIGCWMEVFQWGEQSNIESETICAMKKSSLFSSCILVVLNKQPLEKESFKSIHWKKFKTNCLTKKRGDILPTFFYLVLFGDEIWPNFMLNPDISGTLHSVELLHRPIDWMWRKVDMNRLKSRFHQSIVHFSRVWYILSFCLEKTHFRLLWRWTSQQPLELQHWISLADGCYKKRIDGPGYCKPQLHLLHIHVWMWASLKGFLRWEFLRQFISGFLIPKKPT